MLMALILGPKSDMPIPKPRATYYLLAKSSDEHLDLPLHITCCRDSIMRGS